MASTQSNSSDVKKTITIDVNDHSYYKGYEDASAACTQPELGWKENLANQGQELFVSLLPLRIFIALFVFLLRPHWKNNKIIMDRQKEAVDSISESQELVRETNRLLAEISQKLGTK